MRSLKRFLRPLVPMMLAAAAITGSALAATGDYQMVTVAPHNAAACGVNMPIQYPGQTNVRGTHSWSGFHWTYKAWNGLGNQFYQSPVYYGSGFTYPAGHTVPQGTAWITYAITNDAGSTDSFWCRAAV